MPITIERALELNFDSLYTASREGEYTVVETPFTLPDGDGIGAYIRTETDGTFLLTDLGTTLGWLRHQRTLRPLTEAEEQRLMMICRQLGATQDDGELTMRCPRASDLPECIVSFSQAIVQIGEMRYMPEPDERVAEPPPSTASV